MNTLGNSFSNLNEAIAYLQNKMPDYRFDKRGRPYYVFGKVKHLVPKKRPIAVIKGQDGLMRYKESI